MGGCSLTRLSSARSHRCETLPLPYAAGSSGSLGGRLLHRFQDRGLAGLDIIDPGKDGGTNSNCAEVGSVQGAHRPRRVSG